MTKQVTYAAINHHGFVISEGPSRDVVLEDLYAFIVVAHDDDTRPDINALRAMGYSLLKIERTSLEDE